MVDPKIVVFRELEQFSDRSTITSIYNYAGIYRALEGLCGSLAGKRLLEYGPREGVLIPALLDKEADVYAVDNGSKRPIAGTFMWEDILALSRQHQKLTTQHFFEDVEFAQFHVLSSRDFMVPYCRPTLTGIPPPLSLDDISTILASAHDLAMIQVHDVSPAEDVFDEISMRELGYIAHKRVDNSFGNGRHIWILSPIDPIDYQSPSQPALDHCTSD